MHKKTLYLLIFTITSITHGMGKFVIPLQGIEPADNMFAIFGSDDLLPCITEQICIDNYWVAENITKDIRALAFVNKFLFNFCSQYYTDSNRAKNFIKKIALASKEHDHDAACKFGNTIISSKIIRLFHIAISEKQFTKEDLEDKWYLNATGWCTHQDARHSTLLLATFRSYNVHNAKMVLKTGINLNTAEDKNPIQFMAQIDYSLLTRKEKEGFFAIARLLLAKGIHPDSRFRITCPTLLHRAVSNNNRHFTYSLLKAGADPYNLLITLPNCTITGKIPINSQLKEYNPEKSWYRNAFYINGEYIVWLQDLIVKLQAEKNNPTPVLGKKQKRKTKQK